MNWNDPAISRQQFFQEWVKATNDRDYQPLLGESSRSTGTRVSNFIKSIFNPHENLVLVSHGGAILDYLRNIFGDDQLMDLRTKYEEGEDYQMINCSINHINLSEGPKIHLLNYTGHLSQLTE